MIGNNKLDQIANEASLETQNLQVLTLMPAPIVPTYSSYLKEDCEAIQS